jgi:Tol biopolymer transport system component
MPASVKHLLQRCLERDPRQRLRDVGEARIALTPPVGGAETRGDDEREPSGRRWGAGHAAGAVAALLAALAVGYVLRAPPPPPTPAVDPNAIVRQLTFEPGLEAEPSFSPDGHYIAYTTNDRGSLDVAVLPVNGGAVRWLADGEADEAQPAWSPDGTQVAFTSARDHSGRLMNIGGLSALSPFVQGQGGDIFLVPAPGGRAVKLVERGSFPAWSPDGRWIAFQSDRGGQWDIWAVPAQGGEPRPLTRDADIDYQPAWSPDGKWIVYASNAGLKVVASDGSGEPQSLTATEGRGVLAPAWSPDGRWIYFASTHDLTEGTSNLWRMEFFPSGGQPGRAERITLGTSADVDPALAAGGHRLAYSEAMYSPDLWEVDLATGARRQITFTSSLDDYPHLSPDGQSLVFFSDRAGQAGIWTIRPDGNGLQAITPPGMTAIMPRWSPDGGHLAFLRRDAAGNALVVQPVGGLSARELDSTDEEFGSPDWSPDGRKLAYSRTAGGGTSAIWSIEIGGTPRRVAAPGGNALSPTWSPDGQRLAFQHEQGGDPRQIWLVPAEGGEARPITSSSLEHSHPQWSPVDADRILVVIDHKNLAVLSVATGELEYLTDYDDSTLIVDYPSWSSDASKVYFSLTRKVGDLILIESRATTDEDPPDD